MDDLKWRDALGRSPAPGEMVPDRRNGWGAMTVPAPPSSVSGYRTRETARSFYFDRVIRIWTRLEDGEAVVLPAGCRIEVPQDDEIDTLSFAGEGIATGPLIYRIVADGIDIEAVTTARLGSRRKTASVAALLASAAISGALPLYEIAGAGYGNLWPAFGLFLAGWLPNIVILRVSFDVGFAGRRLEIANGPVGIVFDRNDADLLRYERAADPLLSFMETHAAVADMQDAGRTRDAGS